MSTRGILKIIGSIASLSMIMLLVSCGGGGGNNSTSNAENQAAVEVSGRILDSSSIPVEGATVTFASVPVVVTTDNLGNFSAKVAPGDHTITVSKDNITFYQQVYTVNEGPPISLGDLSPTTPYYQNGDGSSPKINNLQIDFSTSDCIITWQVSSIYAVDYFTLTIQDSSSLPVIHTESHLTGSSFTYTFVMNDADHIHQASRNLYIVLTAYSSSGQTVSESVTAYNPPPSQVQLPTITALISGLEIQWPMVSGDTVYYEVGVSPTDPESGTLYLVTNNDITIGNLPSVLEYVAVRACDAFGPGPWSPFSSDTPISLIL
ncbi:MAG: carboxypeptidase-like regulatory domain-containing protein [Desulfomonilia bacterium]